MGYSLLSARHEHTTGSPKLGQSFWSPLLERGLGKRLLDLFLHEIGHHGTFGDPTYYNNTGFSAGLVVKLGWMLDLPERPHHGFANLVQSLVKRGAQQLNQPEADGAVLADKGRELLSIDEPDLGGLDGLGRGSIRAACEGCREPEDFAWPDYS